VQKSLDETQLLFDSLTQQYFGNEKKANNSYEMLLIS